MFKSIRTAFRLLKHGTHFSFLLFLLFTGTSAAYSQISQSACCRVDISHKRLFKDKPDRFSNLVCYRADSKDTIVGLEIIVAPSGKWSPYNWHYKQGILYTLHLSDSTYETDIAEDWKFNNQGLFQMYLSVPFEWLKDFDRHASYFDTTYRSFLGDTTVLHLRDSSWKTIYNTFYSFTTDSFLLNRSIRNFTDGDSEIIVMDYQYISANDPDSVFKISYDRIDNFRYLPEEPDKPQIKFDLKKSATLQSEVNDFFRKNPEQQFVLLDFWHYECKYCHNANKDIQKLIASDSLKVISVYCREDIGNTVKAKLANDYSYYSKMIYLPRAISRSLGVNGFPRLIIVDRELNVRLDLTGYREENMDLISDIISR